MLRLLVFAAFVAGCGGGDGNGGDGGIAVDALVSVDASPGQLDAPPAADAGTTGRWRPAPGTTWQYVDMYDIDLFDTPQTTIDTLHGAGRIVVCYFSAGSYEEWRDDAGDLPVAALGNNLDGWPGERWLDVRNAGVRNVMKSRLDLAVTKRCDAVEPDNVDGYDNNPGFPLTASDQLEYNRFLATEAHARGLSIGLKNDLAQVPQLVGHFDWALNEECFAYNECADLTPFIAAGKAVFSVEYGAASLADTVCPQASALGFDTLIKKLDLDVWRVACP
jgi:hypothetical protein